MRRLAIILCGAAMMLLAAAGAAGGPSALVVMGSGMAFGLLATLVILRPDMEAARHGTADLHLQLGRAAEETAAARAECAAIRAECEAMKAAQERLSTLEARTSTLRHDIRGILSPSLLVAERLTGNADPAVRRAGDIMLQMVERATARLNETKVSGPR